MFDVAAGAPGLSAGIENALRLDFPALPVSWALVACLAFLVFDRLFVQLKGQPIS